MKTQKKTEAELNMEAIICFCEWLDNLYSGALPDATTTESESETNQ